MESAFLLLSEMSHFCGLKEIPHSLDPKDVGAPSESRLGCPSQISPVAAGEQREGPGGVPAERVDDGIQSVGGAKVPYEVRVRVAGSRDDHRQSISRKWSAVRRRG